jgi:hypothetical protein
MINTISKSWKTRLSSNINSEIRIYLDPRRVEYAPISGSSTFHENTANDPCNGQYSLDISTEKYMAPFSMPITFEVYCKPEFAYDVATDQEFFVFGSDAVDNARVALCYYAATDQIGLKVYTSTGGASPTQVDVLLSQVYTNNADLQTWERFTCTISTDGISLYSDGDNKVTDATDISSHKAKVSIVPGNGVDLLINYALVYYGFVASDTNISECFKEVKNEAVFFNFQRVGLGNTRCDITKKANDFTHTYKDGYSSAEMQLSLKNLNGEFSSDQYAPFSPSQYSYNGLLSEKYLAFNNCGVSLEYRANKRTAIMAGRIAQYQMDNLAQMPDCTSGVSYSNNLWATTDSWTTGAGEGTLYIGSEILRNVGVVAGNKIAIENTAGRASVAGDTLRIRIRGNKSISMEAFYYPGGSKTSVGTFTIGQSWDTFDFFLTNASDGIRIESVGNASDGDMLLFDFIYIGVGIYSSGLSDVTGNGNDLTPVGPYPYSVLSGNGIYLDGDSDYCMVPLISTPDVLSLTTWCYARSFDSTACPISTHYYDASDSFGFGFSFVNSTTVRVHYGQGAGSAAAYKDITVSTYALSTLYHWAVTYTAGDTYFRVYRNGALVGTSTAAATFDAQAELICIGNYPYMNKILLTDSSYSYLVSEDGYFLEEA